MIGVRVRVKPLPSQDNSLIPNQARAIPLILTWRGRRDGRWRRGMTSRRRRRGGGRWLARVRVRVRVRVTVTVKVMVRVRVRVAP